MPVEQGSYNDNILAESHAAGLMALRSSFCLPVALAALFLIFDIYRVHMQTDYTGMSAGAVASLYGFALLEAVNNYFPSTLLPFAAFAVLQQGIYRVPAGMARWTLGGGDVLGGGLSGAVRRIHRPGRDGCAAVRGDDGIHCPLWIQDMVLPRSGGPQGPGGVAQGTGQTLIHR